MPYRAELKRPDLKGQFPCSVCGKVFCHSSSLSRHRMQAHFKSYTCTQCNQEISSNETLRSHMFRIHAISRMFMCRCCNWAFPDKTSLHIHMQSMLRNGHPGDVSVLARSSTEGDDGPGMGMEASPSASPHSDSPHSDSPIKINNNNNNTSSKNHNTALVNNNNNNTLNGSIFPNLATLAGLRGRENGLPGVPPELAAAQNQWLAAWLANNAFATPMHLAGVQAQLLSNNESLDLTNEKHEKHKLKKEMEEDDDDDDALEITCDDTLSVKDDKSSTTKSPAHTGGSRLDSLLFTKRVEPTENRTGSKRKAPNPKKVLGAVDGEPEAKVTALTTTTDSSEGVNGDVNGNGAMHGATSSSEQPSPAVSDSHTSASSAPHSIDSPAKCFDCSVSSDFVAKIQQLQAAKTKLQMTENKVRALEAKVGAMELHQSRLEGKLVELDATNKEHVKEKNALKLLCDASELRLREYQERCQAALAIVGTGVECLPAVRIILENLIDLSRPSN